MIGKISTDDIREYIENNIDHFHQARLSSLKKLKLKQILKRKNPYLFKAKNIIAAPDLIKSVLEAHLSSQEETMFGEFLEKLAIYICGWVYGGKKSEYPSIDLEFEKNNTFYIVSIKSGPNWGNADQQKKMRENFAFAIQNIYKNHPTMPIMAVNGCCYGQEMVTNKGSYLKYCGQDFWEFISGISDLYKQIIEPLGFNAKARNEQFMYEYAKIITNLTVQFAQEFCDDGAINWNRVLEFNSGRLSQI